MENKNNYIENLNNNNVSEYKTEGPIRKYLQIIKTFENLQPFKNKEREQDFHVVLSHEEKTYRIHRTSKKGDINNEEIVTDYINDNAYGINKECIIMYTLTKDLDGKVSAIIRDISGDSAQNIPVLIEKLESVVKQKGTKITFIPGGTFDFDGNFWKEIK